MSQTATSQTPDAAPMLRGLLVEFDSPGALLTAAELVRDAGYRHWDTHAPFPVHGIDEAMGIRPTRLPWIILICGVLGCLTGLGLQWWANSTSGAQFPGVPAFLQGYDFVISGKPRFSLPANIPVIFEITVLFSALGAVIGMLASNSLPWHHNPLFGLHRFKRVTSDRFFIAIEARDPLFEERRTGDWLKSLGGLALERIEDDGSPAVLPRRLVIGGIVVVCLAILPPLYVAKARVTTSELPRIHVVADMDNQPKYIMQQAAPLFADGRAMRPVVPGTIARGDLQMDAHFFEGKVGGEFATTFPPQIEISEALVRRGQQRFNIYCTPCHGLGGAGDGIVNARAQALGATGWVQPLALVEQVVRDRPNGHIFNTITNGIRTMPPYGDQIPPADRWAIVAYVRALQLSQNARLEDIPADRRPELRGK